MDAPNDTTQPGTSDMSLTYAVAHYACYIDTGTNVIKVCTSWHCTVGDNTCLNIDDYLDLVIKEMLF